MQELPQIHNWFLKHTARGPKSGGRGWPGRTHLRWAAAKTPGATNKGDVSSTSHPKRPVKHQVTMCRETNLKNPYSVSFETRSLRVVFAAIRSPTEVPCDPWNVQLHQKTFPELQLHMWHVLGALSGPACGCLGREDLGSWVGSWWRPGFAQLCGCVN